MKKLKDAWKEYRATKKIAHTLRLTFQEEIFARKAIDCKVTTEQLTKMMICEEGQDRRAGIPDRYVEGIPNSQS